MMSLLLLLAWLLCTTALNKTHNKTACDKQCVADGFRGSACFAGCECQDDTIDCAFWCSADNGALYHYSYSGKNISSNSVNQTLDTAEGLTRCLIGCTLGKTCIAANCSLATEEICLGLNRNRCWLFEHVCGDCLEGYASASKEVNSYCKPGLTLSITTGAGTTTLMKAGEVQPGFSFHENAVPGREALSSRQDQTTVSLSTPFNASFTFSVLLVGPARLVEKFPKTYQIIRGEVWDFNLTFDCVENGLVEVAFDVKVDTDEAVNTTSLHVLRLQKRCMAKCFDTQTNKSLCYRGTCEGRFCSCEGDFRGDFCTVFLGAGKDEYCPGEEIEVEWVLSAATATTSDWVGIIMPFCVKDGVAKAYERLGCDGQTVEPVLSEAQISAAARDLSDYASGWLWFYLSGDQTYPEVITPSGSKTISVTREDAPGNYAVALFANDGYNAQIVTTFVILDKTDPKCTPSPPVTCLEETTDSVTAEGVCLCKERFWGADCSLGCPEFTEMTAFGSVIASSPYSLGPGYQNSMRCSYHLKPADAPPGSKIHFTSSAFGIHSYDKIQVYEGDSEDPAKEFKPPLNGLAPISMTFNANELLLVFKSDLSVAGDPAADLVGFVLTYQLVGACAAGSFINKTDVTNGKAVFQEASCVPCPLGQFSTTDDSSLCTRCPRGTYSNNTAGASACIESPPGSFSASACIESPPGSFSLDGAALFTMCEPGSYQARSGQDACLPCQVNTYADEAGMQACLPCKRGSEAAEGSMVCVESVSKARKALAAIMFLSISFSHLAAFLLLGYRFVRPTPISSKWPGKLLVLFAVTSLIVLAIPISTLLTASFSCAFTYWFGSMRVHLLLAPIACIVYYLSSLLSISRIRHLLQMEVSRMAKAKHEAAQSRRQITMLLGELAQANVKPWKMAGIFFALILVGSLTSFLIWLNVKANYPIDEFKCQEGDAMVGLECFFVIVYACGLLTYLASMSRRESLGIKSALSKTLSSLLFAAVIYFPIAFVVGFSQGFDQRVILWAWSECAIFFLVLKPYAKTLDFFKPAEEKVNKKNVNLLDLLRTERGYQFFLAHCQREFSEENVLCWKQIEDYVRNTSVTALENICRNFLLVDAPFQVNISDSLQREVKKRYHFRKKSSLQELQHVLDPVQEELEKLMRSDTLQRFLQSDLFRAYEKGDASPADFKHHSRESSTVSTAMSTGAAGPKSYIPGAGAGEDSDEDEHEIDPQSMNRDPVSINREPMSNRPSIHQSRRASLTSGENPADQSDLSDHKDDHVSPESMEVEVVSAHLRSPSDVDVVEVNLRSPSVIKDSLSKRAETQKHAHFADPADNEEEVEPTPMEKLSLSSANDGLTSSMSSTPCLET
eukprot:g33424.t1